MNKLELNKYAITLAQKAFQDRGFKIEHTPMPAAQADFLAISGSNTSMKIKVRAISQLGSYVFIPKRKFNIKDLDLYVALLYIPYEHDEKMMYLIPATDWGISFSRKAKDAMESYRFSHSG